MAPFFSGAITFFFNMTPPFCMKGYMCMEGYIKGF